MRKEMRVLKSLTNEHIVKFIEYFETDSFIIIMELCEYGDLDNQITLQRERGWHFEETEILNCLAQVCKALQKAHYFNVVHGDIKPQNIFVKRDNTVKVGDFGISIITGEKAEVSSKGTISYMSPETFRGISTSKRDIWALGCVIHEVCGLKRTFVAENNHIARLRAMIEGEDPCRIPENYSDGLATLV